MSTRSYNVANFLGRGSTKCEVDDGHIGNTLWIINNNLKIVPTIIKNKVTCPLTNSLVNLFDLIK